MTISDFVASKSNKKKVVPCSSSACESKSGDPDPASKDVITDINPNLEVTTDQSDDPNWKIVGWKERNDRPVLKSAGNTPRHEVVVGTKSKNPTRFLLLGSHCGFSSPNLVPKLKPQIRRVT